MMKNLFLAATLVLALSLNASSHKVVNNVSVITLDQEKEYKKVETSQVPTEVLKQAGAKYAGYALIEAHVAGDGEYKLVLSKDGKSLKVYFKGTGEFVKEEA
ncbi:hypothetical protein [Flavobacterium cerinum]|uniref:Beta-lactamase-inhibitor-like PepSY-like domain-containing protein n=1 Tax=Flavobacterium cerinum TaxID=2502784 RepID=A0A444HDF0_9FLAO|nr:hypothetical protein [Flavobacterium cerinum]RWX02187.1 hypothetical protein EPI11_02915 [Flavobacterium cerinum]